MHQSKKNSRRLLLPVAKGESEHSSVNESTPCRTVLGLASCHMKSEFQDWQILLDQPRPSPLMPSFILRTFIVPLQEPTQKCFKSSHDRRKRLEMCRTLPGGPLAKGAGQVGGPSKWSQVYHDVFSSHSDTCLSLSTGCQRSSPSRAHVTCPEYDRGRYCLLLFS